MSTYGYCLTHRADVPVVERYCAEDGSLALPPSWSKQDAPWPWPARPEDYTPRYAKLLTQAAPPPPPVKGTRHVWRAPIVTAPKPKRQAAPRLPRQRQALTPKAPRQAVVHAAAPRVRPSRPAPQRRAPRLVTCEHCHQTVEAVAQSRGQRFCSSRCRNAARDVARALARRQRHDATGVCPVCHTTFDRQLTGGPLKRYCSKRCRDKQGSRLKWTRTMADQGRVCVACGRGDRPHRAHGLCTPCWRKAPKGAAATARWERSCVVCGATFAPQSSHPDQEACSPSCGASLRERRKRAGRAA